VLWIVIVFLSQYGSEFLLDADPDPEPDWHQNDVLNMLENKGKNLLLFTAMPV
jgi:hypothetical protein